MAVERLRERWARLARIAAERSWASQALVGFLALLLAVIIGAGPVLATTAMLVGGTMAIGLGAARLAGLAYPEHQRMHVRSIWKRRVWMLHLPWVTSPIALLPTVVIVTGMGDRRSILVLLGVAGLALVVLYFNWLLLALGDHRRLCIGTRSSAWAMGLCGAAMAGLSRLTGLAVLGLGLAVFLRS